MTDTNHNSLTPATPQARQLAIHKIGAHFIVVDGHGCFFAKTYFEPDARRIAAVFDLLEALQEMVELADGLNAPRFTRARAAIAKATGRTA